MKDNGENDLFGKCYSFLGGLSGRGGAQIARLRSKDLKVAENLGALFMSA
jgi:hypothetical protein